MLSCFFKILEHNILRCDSGAADLNVAPEWCPGTRGDIAYIYAFLQYNNVTVCCICGGKLDAEERSQSEALTSANSMSKVALDTQKKYNSDV